MSSIDTVARELRVGFAVYWLTLTSERSGWRVRWDQRGESREVFSEGPNTRRAVAEAYLLASRLDAPPVPDTEPELPESTDG